MAKLIENERMSKEENDEKALATRECGLGTS